MVNDVDDYLIHTAKGKKRHKQKKKTTLIKKITKSKKPNNIWSFFT